MLPLLFRIAQSKGYPVVFGLRDAIWRNMLTISKLTGNAYEPARMVHIINPTQSAMYCANGAELVDLYVGRDYKWVFVFDRDATADLYDKYCKWELRK